MSDDWTGPRDGPFRGRRLYRCTTHPLCWRYENDVCPACEIERARLAEFDLHTERLKMLTECETENTRLRALLAKAMAKVDDSLARILQSPPPDPR